MYEWIHENNVKKQIVLFLANVDDLKDWQSFLFHSLICLSRSSLLFSSFGVILM